MITPLVAIKKINSISIKIFVDTGTSLVYLPDQVLHDFYASVPKAFYDSNQLGYVFPCGTALPDLTLVVGNYKAVAPGYFFESKTQGFSKFSP